ncbi:PAS domain S-box protein [Methylobacter sp. YRD-M1]|uniref:PAS domain S-box protein n=1 Tax=Methylobacter sp. YRD-M1 TaxID=2911520 RepID=UPI00227C13F7|nr:PAS domain S-box protein [Methylobacter sp. YRD-M1]WAK03236.1 PAS domain S-box protein [Methylobacter sp. YRD-M1]
MKKSHISTDSTSNTQALQRLKSHFKKIIEQMDEIVFTVNSDGCFTFLNPAWQVHTGYEIVETIGQPIHNFIHSDDSPIFLEYNNATTYSEIRILDKSHNTLWFKMSLKTIQEKPCLKAFSGILTNITAQKNLEASEILFTSLVENTSEIFFQIDNLSKLIFLSPAWSKITGYSIEESLHQSLLFYAHEDDRSNILRFLHAKRDPTITSSCIDFRLVTQSGQIRWVSMRFRTSGSDFHSIDKITGTLQDITVRVNAERDLRIDNEQLIAAVSNGGIWDWNLLTDEVCFSPRWKEMMGYADDELENSYSSLYNLIHPDDLKEEKAKLTSCLQSKNNHYETVYRLKNKSGGWSWILCRGIITRDASGMALHITGSHSDINQLRQIEEVLIERYRELNTIFSMNPDGIVTFTSNNCLSSVNHTFLSMTGFSSEELTLISESEFTEKMRSISAPGLSYVIDKNQPFIVKIQPICSQIKRPSAARHDNKLNTAYLNSNARILKVTTCEFANESISKIIYFRDVTIETEADHMKYEFLCNAAHELRTPMSSVYGFTELLLTREFDKVIKREILQNIHQQSASLVKMINDLLDLAKIEARTGNTFHFAIHPLESVVRQACVEFMIQGDTRTIKTLFKDESHLVYMDIDQIKRALTNVISNAFKYSPNGGEISIDICRRNNIGDSSEVGVLIKDHGIGMTQEEISRMFDRFWRSSNANHITGTGLGMPLVKEIMNIHQGHIEITSTPGLGTEVALWFKENKHGGQNDGNHC